MARRLRGDPGQRAPSDPVQGRQVATTLRCWSFLPGGPALAGSWHFQLRASHSRQQSDLGVRLFVCCGDQRTIHCTAEQRGRTLPTGCPQHLIHPGNNQKEQQRLPCVSWRRRCLQVRAPSWNHTHSWTGTTSKEKASGKTHTR